MSPYRGWRPSACVIGILAFHPRCKPVQQLPLFPQFAGKSRGTKSKAVILCDPGSYLGNGFNSRLQHLNLYHTVSERRLAEAHR